ncbi:MAG: hypothetical protein ACK4VI_07805 [Alphaproteobacteria bacterium]
MKKGILTAALLGAAVSLAACKQDEQPAANNGNQNSATATAPNQIEQSPRSRFNQQFFVSVAAIPVVRDGKPFTVDALGYCDTMTNLTRNNTIDNYRRNCEAAIREKVTQRACTSGSFLAGTATNNPEIRALTTGRPIEEVGDSLLFTADNIRNNGTVLSDSAMRYDFLIIENVSDIEAANRGYYLGERPPESCPAP